MKSFEINAKPTLVFYLHGLRGHGLAQEAALQHMVRNLGVSLISLEMDGHGQESITRHCLVPRYQQTVKDICEEIKRHAIHADQVILMGYSFGATLMLLAAEDLHKDPEFSPLVAGSVGVSSAFDVGHNVPAWKLFLSRAIGPTSRYLFERSSSLSPFLTIQEMDIGLISADQTVVESITNDALVYKGRIPLATSAQVYQSGLAAKACLKQSSIPTLLVHSRDDQIAIVPHPKDFGSNVVLHLFNKLRHNCIDGVMKEVIKSRQHITQFIVEKL